MTTRIRDFFSATGEHDARSAIKRYLWVCVQIISEPKHPAVTETCKVGEKSLEFTVASSLLAIKPVRVTINTPDGEYFRPQDHLVALLTQSAVLSEAICQAVEILEADIHAEDTRKHRVKTTWN